MFTNSLEFEGFKPFDHIAGCSLGTWTDRESCVAILKVMAKAGREDIRDWRELAETVDDDCGNWLQDLADDLNDNCADLMPPYCSAIWEDNELRITPYIDDELERVNDIPENAPDGGDDCVLYVNDHGNVTLYQWRVYAEKPSEWSEVWSMV